MAVEVSRFDWRAYAGGEDQAGFRPVLAGGLSFSLLDSPVPSKSGYAWSGQTDKSFGLIGLDRAEHQLAIETLQGLPDDDDAIGQVDVRPPKPEGFPTTQAAATAAAPSPPPMMVAGPTARPARISAACRAPGGQGQGLFFTCCGDNPDSAQHQWRSYGWDGTRFVQVGGPTAFGPNPNVTDLAVTASDLVMVKAGRRHLARNVTTSVVNRGDYPGPWCSAWSCPA